MDHILARIKKAYHLETDAEVADFLGIKPSTLSMQKNRGKLNLERILKKCSKLNKNWLLHGEGSVWRTNVEVKEESHIPIFSNIELCGDGEPHFSKSEKVSTISADGEEPEYIKKFEHESLMGYVVTVDSMEPTIRKNDIAIVDRSDKTPTDGAIYLISFNSTTGCRRIQGKPGGIYSITSDNKAYESYDIAIDKDNFTIIGKVVWIIRNM